MKSLVSDAVILCDETKLRFVETAHFENLKTGHAVVTGKIVRAFKGDLKVGSEMDIRFDAVFARHRVGQHGYTDTSHWPSELPNP